MRKSLVLLPLLLTGCPSQPHVEYPTAIRCFDAASCRNDCSIAHDDTSCRLAACFEAKESKSTYGFWSKILAGTAGALGLAASAVKSDWKYAPGGASALTGGLSAGLMYKADTEGDDYNNMSCKALFVQEELE